MNKKYQAVIFDMNGVIVDDEPLHELAFKHVLKTAGHDFSHADYLQFFAGRSDKTGFQEYQKHAQEEVFFDLAEITEQKQQVYQELFQKLGVLYDGIPEIIVSLYQRRIPLAVVTGATREETNEVLALAELAPYFSSIITAEDVKQGKPNPDGYLLAAHNLAVSPEQCIVIEDTPTGVRAAKNAGMFCIAITNTHVAKELSGADVIVDSLNDADWESLLMT